MELYNSHFTPCISILLPITDGKLDLGRWQRIFYAEFDGQRDKRVIVKVMGSDDPPWPS
jgi:thiamine phosphate synthase YjbQ (UPF0047 family)